MKNDTRRTILEEQGIDSRRLLKGRREKRRYGRRRRIIKYHHNNNSSNANRTSFPDAISLIMKQLAEEQRPLSISGLSRDTRIHRKTVEKGVELLFELEKNWLDTYRVKLDNIDDRRRIVSLERRTGLLSYPEEIQNLIIKANHIPRPSEELTLIIHLYLRDAISAERAIPLPEKDEIVRRLEKQGQIIRKKETQQQQQQPSQVGREEKEEDNNNSSSVLFYLSKEGVIVAKGALRVFPELNQK